MLGLQPRPDALPGQHLVDGGVLADVAEELEQRERLRPLTVVDEAARPAFQVDDAGDLRLDRRHVAVERGVVEQVALLRAPARVADHARRSPGQGDRHVTGVLEPAQHDQPDQVAVVQAVGRRVAAVVDGDRTACQAGGERVTVGRLLDQAAGVEVGEQVHRHRSSLHDASERAPASERPDNGLRGRGTPWRHLRYRAPMATGPDTATDAAACARVFAALAESAKPAGAAVRPHRRGHRRRPRAGRIAAAGPADAASAGAVARMRPIPPARRPASRAGPATTRASRSTLIRAIRCRPSAPSATPTPTSWPSCSPLGARRPTRSAAAPCCSPSSVCSPPRSATSPISTSARAPASTCCSTATSTPTSLAGRSVVRRRCASSAAPAGPCPCRRPCRRSCSAAGSIGRRSTSTTLTSAAGWKPASGRTRPTASSGCGRRSSSPLASSSTSAQVTPSPTRRGSPPRSTPTRS